MSGIVFLLGVAAFVLVAYWAFINDRRRGDEGQVGPFRMKTQTDTAATARGRARWSRAGASADRAAQRGEPRWRRRTDGAPNP